MKKTAKIKAGSPSRRIDARPAPGPDGTAVRVALWRALHVEADAPPHVLEDAVGLKLAAPDDGWRRRPDMSPFTRPFRASIVARARFVEDLVAERTAQGVGQYAILGAGLDTFAQRRPELAARLVVFEIDRPGPQEWKRRRLVELGLGVPPFLRFVPVDFEAGDAWWDELAAAGFDPARPAVVASTGVSMYLTKEAIAATLCRVASLAPGSALVMSFMLPIELADPEVRPGIERAAAGARANGTPFISFFTPAEMLALARGAGFKTVEHVSAAALGRRYFAGRTDGLRPPNNSEELLVAST
ncbi:MAG: class I SAM-dependent methyltransferase [Elusimicrobia bacterium]|nr:class I SAM-dependent methyltransferase [Elusimicrobiota bacterium]